MSNFMHDFVMKGFKGAIGKMPDYWVRTNAVGHLEKGTLTEEDLQELDALIEAKNSPPEVVDDELDMVMDDGVELVNENNTNIEGE